VLKTNKRSKVNFTSTLPRIKLFASQYSIDLTRRRAN